MNDRPDVQDGAAASGFREASATASFLAFVLGGALLGASIALGRSHTFFGAFLAFSALMTLLWRNVPRPWISLVSMSAATPIAVSKQQFACNLVFALWLSLLKVKYLFRLPRWIYLPFVLSVLGVFASSVNWMRDDVVRNILRQGAFASNFVLSSFILLPMTYFRMEQSRESAANLRGLLFFLILPSTLILLSAKCLGSVANAWEASLHAVSLPEGFLQYRLGKVLVNFLRTEVGFILAALICASTAVAVSRVGILYRFMAGACLASNAFLLLATGSFGSGFACLCGLSAIFYSQARKGGAIRVLLSALAIGTLLLLTYGLSPQNVKEYLGKRYDHRVVKADKDRVELWGRALEYHLDHPMGVGFTFSVGDGVKTVIHNDYLTYAVSYSFLGGVAYTSLVLGLLVSFFRRGKNMVDDPPAVAIYLAGLGTIVAVAVNSMTDHMAENRWYFNLIWSLIWYSYFCSRGAQRERPGGVEAHPAASATVVCPGNASGCGLRRSEKERR